MSSNSSPLTLAALAAFFVRGYAKPAAIGLAALALGGVSALALVGEGDSGVTDDKFVLCTEFVPSMEASNVYKKWASQNAGERDKWIAFRAGICADQQPLPPTVSTFFGRALVAAGKMALPEPEPLPTTTTTSTTTTT